MCHVAKMSPFLGLRVKSSEKVQAPKVSKTNHVLMIKLVADAQCMPHWRYNEQNVSHLAPVLSK